MKIIGIAGGSGSGKSTISYALMDSDPDRFEVINIDDYHRHRDESSLPMLHGMINWDHPDIMQWDKLISDIRQLKSGRSVIINTKDRRHNPDYATHRKAIRRILQPKPVIIVEGYLALYSPGVRKLLARSYFLDLDHVTRMDRRDKGRLVGKDNYNEKVLVPMHEKYVEPTKAYADEVIDVSNMSIEEVKQKLLEAL